MDIFPLDFPIPFAELFSFPRSSRGSERLRECPLRPENPHFTPKIEKESDFLCHITTQLIHLLGPAQLTVTAPSTQLHFIRISPAGIISYLILCASLSLRIELEIPRGRRRTRQNKPTQTRNVKWDHLIEPHTRGTKIDLPTPNTPIFLQKRP